MADKAQYAPRKHGIDQQPQCGDRDQYIYDDRADASVSVEDRGDEIKVKFAVQSPIYRTEQHKDIRDKICYKH